MKVDFPMGSAAVYRKVEISKLSHRSCRIEVWLCGKTRIDLGCAFSDGRARWGRREKEERASDEKEKRRERERIRRNWRRWAKSVLLAVVILLPLYIASAILYPFLSRVSRSFPSPSVSTTFVAVSHFRDLSPRVARAIFTRQARLCDVSRDATRSPFLKIAILRIAMDPGIAGNRETGNNIALFESRFDPGFL